MNDKYQYEERTSIGNVVDSLEIYWRQNRTNIVSVLLLLCAIYFVIYLLFFDDPTSFILSKVVVLAIILCLIAVCYLQLKDCFTSRYDAYYPQPSEDRYKKIMYEARLAHAKSAFRREPEEKIVPGGYNPRMTPSFDKPYLPREAPVTTGQFKSFPRDEAEEFSFTYANKRPKMEINPFQTSTYGNDAEPIKYGENERKWTPLGVPSIAKTASFGGGDLFENDEESRRARANELFEKLGIKRKMPSWSENVQRWISHTFIPALLRKHHQNMDELNSLLKYYNCRLIFNHSDSLYSFGYMRPLLWEDLYEIIWNKKGDSPLYSFKPTVHIDRMMITEAQLKENLRILVRDRISIEKYFRLPGYKHEAREYVIERMKQLQANFYKEYQNSRGGDWMGEPWSSKYPRDSEIIAGLFFSMIIHLSFSEGTGKEDLFKQFVATYPSYPPTGKRRSDEVWFYRSSTDKQEPHWDLYSGGEVWPSIGGKNNFFYTVALFFYHLKTKCNYYFGQHCFKELIEQNIG